MLKRLCMAALALAALALMQRDANAKALTLGDSAPAIAVKKYVKGTPVTKFEKGKLYVVEFWATWCGPCKVSIPHLTEMAKKYKDVTFIGVSVWEHAQSDVEPFVKTMGDKMDYHIAMDDVPTGKDANSGAMATTWMAAANQNGIPAAFIVDKDSKVAWIGHPMEMEEPLSKVVAGKWDLKVAAADAVKKQAAQAELEELGQKIQPLLAKKDLAGALVVIDKGIATHPGIEEEVWPFRLNLLINLNKDAEAAAYGGKLVDGILHDSSQNLNEFAWNLVNPENPKKAAPPLVEVAVKAAIRADELSKGADAAIADTLAHAYFASGKKDLAISTEERAIKVCTDPAMGADLKKSLDTFKK